MFLRETTVGRTGLNSEFYAGATEWMVLLLRLLVVVVRPRFETHYSKKSLLCPLGLTNLGPVRRRSRQSRCQRREEAKQKPLFAPLHFPAVRRSMLCNYPFSFFFLPARGIETVGNISFFLRSGPSGKKGKKFFRSPSEKKFHFPLLSLSLLCPPIFSEGGQIFQPRAGTDQTLTTITALFLSRTGGPSLILGTHRFSTQRGSAKRLFSERTCLILS